MKNNNLVSQTDVTQLGSRMLHGRKETTLNIQCLLSPKTNHHSCFVAVSFLSLSLTLTDVTSGLSVVVCVVDS